MNLNVIVTDSIQLQDSILLVFSETDIILQKLPIGVGVFDVSNIILQKLPIGIGVFDVSNIILQKLPISVGVSLVSNPIDIIVSDYLTLNDSVSLVTPIRIETGDENLIYDDSIDLINSVVIFLELEDSFEEFSDIAFVIEAFITNLSFSDIISISDQIILSTALSVDQADQIEQIIDYLNSLFGLRLDINDVRLLSDDVNLTVNSIISFYDIFEVLDGSDYRIGLTANEIGDLLDLNDSVNLSLSAVSEISVSDLINLKDSISFDIIYQDDYLRRYLNDRVLKQGDIYLIASDSISLTDTIYVST